MSQLFSDLLAERAAASLACSRCNDNLSCCRAPTLICPHIYRDAEASQTFIQQSVCSFLFCWFGLLPAGMCTSMTGTGLWSPGEDPPPAVLLTTWCSVKILFSYGCTCRRGLHAIKKKITDAPARVRPCTPVFGSAWLKCTCTSVEAEEEPVPVHINQAAVFGRVIRGVPEASFLWLFWFSCRFFADDAFISS